MATIRTVTIKPTGQGGDYTTLGAAVVAIVAASEHNLVARDEVLRLEVSGDWTGVAADNSEADLSTFTTDSTRYVEIYATGTAKHAGVWSTSKYIKTCPTSKHAITIKGCMRIHDLQIAPLATLNGIRIETGVAVEIINIICYAAGSGAWTGVYLNGGTPVLKVRNSIFIGVAHASGDGTCVQLIPGAAGGRYTVYNCTFYNVGYGINQGNGNTQNVTYAKNNIYNIIYRANGPYPQLTNWWPVGTCVNCITSNAADIAVHATNQFNTSPTFEDVANKNFHLASGDTAARGNGVDLSADSFDAFSDDIDGNARSVPWDIGADEALPSQTTTVTGVGSGLVFGTLSANLTVSPASYDDADGFGTLSANSGVFPASVSPSLGFGTMALQVLSPFVPPGWLCGCPTPLLAERPAWHGANRPYLLDKGEPVLYEGEVIYI